MPALVLTSKLVPKGLESTVYALLAGFQNFGGTVSSQIGLYATQAAGIRTTAPCDFTNLGSLVLVAHCLLPLLAVPLTFVLIPDKKMTDSILEPEDGGAWESEKESDGEEGACAQVGHCALAEDDGEDEVIVPPSMVHISGGCVTHSQSTSPKGALASAAWTGSSNRTE
jgi:hypothetical protein